jgi:hypothetical protein
VAERGEHAYASGGRRIRSRDDEPSVLAQRIVDARAGTGGVVVVEGPPGIGKSRLLAEAVSLAACGGLRIRSPRASHPRYCSGAPAS